MNPTSPIVLSPANPVAGQDLVMAIDGAGRALAEMRHAIGQVVFGQDEAVTLALTAILSKGHVLIVGVPGLAKTRLVETLGMVLGLVAKRVQCTPDLMPSDILGSEVLEEHESGRRSFRFIAGPVFSQLLMADEINRASPRTQSALLQAMQEGRISIGGHDHELPTPFHVLATQNPLEQEGTYPLPEAQLDRFLLQIDVTYPPLEAERQMLLSTTMGRSTSPKAMMRAEDVLALQDLVCRMPIGEKVVEGVLAIVRQLRPETTELDLVRRSVVWGAGPRASQALSLASRARALIDGRLSPSMDDVFALLKPVMQHRMALSYSARAEGVTIDAVLAAVRAAVD